MLRPGQGLFAAAVLCLCAAASAQTVQEEVQQAVTTELREDAQDHTHWLFYEVDLTPGNNVEQWVAQTTEGTLTCVVNKNGQKFSKDQQRAAMDAFIGNPSARAKQRKSSQHDDEQAAQMLKMLPQAFVWTKESTKGDETVYSFRPNPSFTPPSWQARVFAAMAGEMTVNDPQKRIVSLK